jgi:hypothetical protein
MITVRTAVAKQCPFKHETDRGELAIICPADAPELHHLGQQVDTLCAAEVSHEDFTRQVLGLLPPGSSVVTTWQTGRWKVEVREGDALLREPMHGANP